MSELTTLYGCIKGAFGGAKNFNNLYYRNKVVVNTLPETDKWPPLTRGLFFVPMEYTKPGFYQIQWSAAI